MIWKKIQKVLTKKREFIEWNIFDDKLLLLIWSTVSHVWLFLFKLWINLKIDPWSQIKSSLSHNAPLSWWREMKLCIDLASWNKFSMLFSSASDIADKTSLSDKSWTPGGIWKFALMLSLKLCWWLACSILWQLNKMWSASSTPLHPRRRHLFDLTSLLDLRKQLIFPTNRIYVVMMRNLRSADARALSRLLAHPV